MPEAKAYCLCMGIAGTNRCEMEFGEPNPIGEDGLCKWCREVCGPDTVKAPLDQLFINPNPELEEV